MWVVWKNRISWGAHGNDELVMLKLFREFDRDGSGYLDEQEFVAALVKANIVGARKTVLLYG